ncbi:hypothetical protein [Lysinibacillus sp. NPDC047702]|uniref:hypothetical protein n=1 Tax=unclassified Lysinibacillus TaxID=2636778 RepID=UPI003D04C0BD
MTERRLTTQLANVREELYNADEVMASGMYAEPSIVIDEMVKEIKESRKDLKTAGDLFLTAILKLQEIQTQVSKVDDKDRTIGVQLSELESELGKLHDMWSEK